VDKVIKGCRAAEEGMRKQGLEKRSKMAVKRKESSKELQIKSYSPLFEFGT
jgi:hypothetical protein